MSIQVDGIKGETMGRDFIKRHFKTNILRQVDWIFKSEGKWYFVEIKNKAMFLAPPFDGHGMDLKQVQTSLQLEKDTGIRYILLCFNPANELIVYWQYLDVLEQGEHFDTARGVRIYKIDNFVKIELEDRTGQIEGIDY